MKSLVSPQFLQQIHAHPQWAFAQKICDTLSDKGFEAVLAGGCVRDAIMGRLAKDLDIATNATPDEVEALFQSWNPVLVGKAFGVIVLPTSIGPIEVATFRKDGEYLDGRRPSSVEFSNLEQDALRRDFTVNALFFRPQTLEILDFVSGQEDLNAGVLRAVGEPKQRFDEDELRILRAIRFSGQLGFRIESATYEAVTQKTAEILKRPSERRGEWVSRERVRDEIDKMLMAKNPKTAFDNLNLVGLGELVFENWAGSILPVRDHVFQPESLEARRLALFYRVFQRASLEQVQEKLSSWKYGRPFLDTALWFMRYEKELRSTASDPIKELVLRELIVQDFREKFEADRRAKESKRDECRHFTAIERDWMTALEHWTDWRAPVVVEVLDAIHGTDTRRAGALKRRGLELGKEDVGRARALDLHGLELQGPNLGRELRRLNREILLKAVRTP